MYIPENEMKLIDSYLKRFSFTGINSIDLDFFLSEWKQEKQRLFKLLGNKLIYEFPYEITDECGDDDLEEEFSLLLYNGYLATLRILIYKNHNFLSRENNDLFFNKVYNFLTDFENLELCLKKNKIYNVEKISYIIKDKKILTLDSDIKLTKFFNKLNHILRDRIKVDYDDLISKFEVFKLKLSMLLPQIKDSGTMCISIHPLDYMTMSDNGNSWSSCMSWKEYGCYRLGTLEMMNSKYVLVAYSKSDKKLTKIKRGETWNSKTWRTLIIFDDDFIISGKHYPNSSDIKVRLVLEKLKELAKENLEIKYKTTPERYYAFSFEKKVKLYSEFMYNDWYEDEEYRHYFMIEKDPTNYVDSPKKINFSGNVYCLSCGCLLDHYYENIEENFLCEDCIDDYLLKECPCCLRDHFSHKFITLDNDSNITVCTECYQNNVVTDAFTDEEMIANITIYICDTEENIKRGYSYSHIYVSENELKKILKTNLIKEKGRNSYILTIPFLTKTAAINKIKEVAGL